MGSGKRKGEGTEVGDQGGRGRGRDGQLYTMFSDRKASYLTGSRCSSGARFLLSVGAFLGLTSAASDL